jgi:Putative peptidoglycan binding domain
MFSRVAKRNCISACVGLILITGAATGLSEERGSENQGQVWNSDRPLDYDGALVTRIQRALRRRGYYGGRTNGFLDQETQEAIARFQVDYGGAVKPVLGRALLVSLGLSRRHRTLSRQKKAHRAQISAAKGYAG